MDSRTHTHGKKEFEIFDDNRFIKNWKILINYIRMLPYISLMHQNRIFGRINIFKGNRKVVEETTLFFILQTEGDYKNN